MHICYEDILSRVEEAPSWWSDGYPRYGAFNPYSVNIYARCVVLVHTKCICGFDFYEAIYEIEDSRIQTLKQAIMEGRIHMGDPPNACEFLTGRPCGSQSDSCREIRVLEFWQKPLFPEGVIPEDVDLSEISEFKRQPEYERDLYDHFAERWGLGSS